MADDDDKRGEREIQQARDEKENRDWVAREAFMSLGARELNRRHRDCEMLLHQAENLR